MFSHRWITLRRFDSSFVVPAPSLIFQMNWTLPKGAIDTKNIDSYLFRTNHRESWCVSTPPLNWTSSSALPMPTAAPILFGSAVPTGNAFSLTRSTSSSVMRRLLCGIARFSFWRFQTSNQLYIKPLNKILNLKRSLKGQYYWGI